jgi:hypothetical protein
MLLATAGGYLEVLDFEGRFLDVDYTFYILTHIGYVVSL